MNVCELYEMLDDAIPLGVCTRCRAEVMMVESDESGLTCPECGNPDLVGLEAFFDELP